MENQLYIPKKIKVGYNKREDTYTKKLAYVIYYDDKGVLRKEKSWESWRDKKIAFNDYDNVPTEGFVLNKGVGGQRESYGWNARNEYIRVYDPRGFEFEISVSNLLFILQECTSTKGKGLEGEFVYSWDGKELVLIPVSCQEYRNSQEYTKLQSNKIGAKELVAGCSYKTKKQEDLIYLGKFDWYTMNTIKDGNYDDRDLVHSKQYIFLKDDKDNQYDKYFITTSLTSLALCNSEIPVSNYAELIEDYNKENINASKPLELEEKTANIKLTINEYCQLKGENRFIKKSNDGKYEAITINAEREWKDGKNIVKGFTLYSSSSIMFKDNVLSVRSNRYNDTSYRSWHSYESHKPTIYTEDQIKSMGLLDVYVKLENNKKMKIQNYGI